MKIITACHLSGSGNSVTRRCLVQKHVARHLNLGSDFLSFLGGAFLFKLADSCFRLRIVLVLIVLNNAEDCTGNADNNRNKKNHKIN